MELNQAKQVANQLSRNATEIATLKTALLEVWRWVEDTGADRDQWDESIRPNIIRLTGLRRYRVSLHEDKGDKHQLIFMCWADDSDHAEERALNAYPNGEILIVMETDEEDQ